ncbi:MAG TPA: sugar ABC transporter substrate-binding protein [Thermoanaerobaculia bacterium]|jgi:ABC-type sugar transport system substrate-binding protein
MIDRTWKWALGIIGSLVLAVLGNALSYRIEPFFAERRVPSAETFAWIFLGSTIAMATALTVTSRALTRHKERLLQRSNVHFIAFISASSGDGAFYSSILHQLILATRSTLTDCLLIVPWLPAESFDHADALKEFRANPSAAGFSGVFVIPKDPDKERRTLESLQREMKIPVVVLDVFFDPSSKTEPSPLHFVGGNEVEGGRIAGEIARDLISAKSKPRVLTLVGRPTKWEMQRVQAFEGYLKEKMRLASSCFERSEYPLNYSRKKAADYMLSWLTQQALTKDRRIKIDIVFACNDDMALGAAEAIRAVRAEPYNYSFVAPPQVVGYDGIDTFTSAMREKDSILAGTVDVNIREQATIAIETMFDLVAKTKATGCPPAAPAAGNWPQMRKLVRP